MKYFYPFIALLILASCQKDEKKTIDHKDTDWAFYKLEGNVKSITTKSWQVNENLEKLKTKHEDQSSRNSDLIFDEDGFLTDEKLYITEAPLEILKYKGREKKQEIIQYINNVPAIKTSYDWDASGVNNLAITRRNSDNSQIDRVEMEYQKNKLAKKTTFSSQNAPNEKITYIYDSKGSVVEENYYNSTDEVQYKVVYKYDKKSKKISDARYTGDGKKNYETISSYDGDNLIRKFVNNNKGETEFSEDFTYDSKGNVITHLTYENIDKSKTLDKFSYDDKGNRIGWQVYKNDVPFMAGRFTYDSHNNQISVIGIDANNKEVDRREYTYAYDAKGNWTKKTVKINGVPQFVAERTITYFDKK